MATAQVKRETLKNIGNVQDWALKQRKDKKEVTKPVKPRSSGKPKVTKAVHVHAAPVLAVPKPLVVATQPFKGEVKDPIENGAQSSAAAGSKGMFVVIYYSINKHTRIAFISFLSSFFALFF